MNEETVLLLVFDLVMIICLFIDTNNDSTVRKRKKQMDEIYILINYLSNTWLDYNHQVNFTEDEEDQLREKICEVAELMNDFYNYHNLDD